LITKFLNLSFALWFIHRRYHDFGYRIWPFHFRHNRSDWAMSVFVASDQ